MPNKQNNSGTTKVPIDLTVEEPDRKKRKTTSDTKRLSTTVSVDLSQEYITYPVRNLGTFQKLLKKGIKRMEGEERDDGEEIVFVVKNTARFPLDISQFNLTDLLILLDTMATTRPARILPGARTGLAIIFAKAIEDKLKAEFQHDAWDEVLGWIHDHEPDGKRSETKAKAKIYYFYRLFDDSVQLLAAGDTPHWKSILDPTVTVDSILGIFNPTVPPSCPPPPGDSPERQIIRQALFSKMYYELGGHVVKIVLTTLEDLYGVPKEDSAFKLIAQTKSEEEAASGPCVENTMYEPVKFDPVSFHGECRAAVILPVITPDVSFTILTPFYGCYDELIAQHLDPIQNFVRGLAAIVGLKMDGPPKISIIPSHHKCPAEQQDCCIECTTGLQDVKLVCMADKLIIERKFEEEDRDDQPMADMSTFDETVDSLVNSALPSPTLTTHCTDNEPPVPRYRFGKDLRNVKNYFFFVQGPWRSTIEQAEGDRGEWDRTWNMYFGFGFGAVRD